MSGPIPSNIPEGTPWPDLDDGEKVRRETLTEAIIAYGERTPFRALKEADLSYTGQARAYIAVRRYYTDPFASQSPFDNFMTQNGMRQP